MRYLTVKVDDIESSLTEGIIQLNIINDSKISRDLPGNTERTFDWVRVPLDLIEILKNINATTLTIVKGSIASVFSLNEKFHPMRPLKTFVRQLLSYDGENLYLPLRSLDEYVDFFSFIKSVTGQGAFHIGDDWSIWRDEFRVISVVPTETPQLDTPIYEDSVLTNDKTIRDNTQDNSLRKRNINLKIIVPDEDDHKIESTDEDDLSNCEFYVINVVIIILFNLIMFTIYSMM